MARQACCMLLYALFSTCAVVCAMQSGLCDMLMLEIFERVLALFLQFGQLVPRPIFSVVA
jgi:hypothetical protein